MSSQERPEPSDDLFVEQAEYLKPEDLLRLSSQHPQEKAIIRKLSGAGAKLLTGPRGCGKTTLLLKAKAALLSDSRSGSLPVYVNYKVSLKLEPLYREEASASLWFKQWILAKICLGIRATLDELEIQELSNITPTADALSGLVSKLELGGIPRRKVIQIGIPDLVREVENALEAAGKKRCVLLLDDAAHTFSSSQQRDFFEIFRQLKSRLISPKAAIYPGVTVYDPGFQVGHDAEEISAWIDPYAPDYIPFMKDLIRRRIPDVVFEGLSKNPGYFDLLAYAAFGMPRAALNSIRRCYDGDGADYKFAARKTLDCIRESYQNTLSVYKSLSLKMRTYSRFIEEGSDTFARTLSALKEFNKGKSRKAQSITVAIKENASQEIQRMFGFYQYAGLVALKKQLAEASKELSSSIVFTQAV